MSRNPVSAGATSPTTGCYRLTAKGRAFVDMVETPTQTLGSLTRYLHDVLMMCGSGVWFEQLRQFMPPRSLEESLSALLALELIEQIEQEAPRYAAPSLYRPRPSMSAFGQLAGA
jgi:hypothetical protein